MGIGTHLVEALIRERAYRPIVGETVLIGRQTVYHTAPAILDLLHSHGIDTGSTTAADIEIDRRTIDRLEAFAGQDLISDAALFRLLGVPKVSALDHSAYEGAEIVHNLTTPLPPRLRSCADFIVDGSTLDNVFDPAMVIRNFAEMLKPGGRLVTTNVFGDYGEPYVIIPPLWFADYFVMNGFSDCKVYIVAYGDASVGESDDVFTINLDALAADNVSPFVCPRMMATIVVAEKGPRSTSHIRPTQRQYRPLPERAAYLANLETIARSPRPHLVRTHGNISFFDVRGGHLFVANDFTTRDPTTEIAALHSGQSED